MKKMVRSFSGVNIPTAPQLAPKEETEAKEPMGSEEAPGEEAQAGHRMAHSVWGRPWIQWEASRSSQAQARQAASAATTKAMTAKKA